jgi:hypothetical protein
MEIRLARHGRHIAIVSIDNQPRLNALTRQVSLGIEGGPYPERVSRA